MSASSDHYPWLVADIGGTHARFGLVRGSGRPVQDVISLDCGDHASVEDAAAAYLRRVAPAAPPRLAAFAVASPVDGDEITFTNSPWRLSRERAAWSLGLGQLLLLNDLEAVALAMPALVPERVAFFGGRWPALRQTMAVIAPGTGLGVAACVPIGEQWIALATEGGHATATAADDFEAEVLRIVREEHEHVSAERILSGIGLPVLHRAIARISGSAVAPDLTPEAITRRGIDGGDRDCAATLDTFFAMLGTFAGNVALTVGARGGVFLAGGVAQRLAARFERSRFRSRFEAKGRFRGYMQSIPTGLIDEPNAALDGSAQRIRDVLAGRHRA